jgi:hypothetical protein
MTKDWIGSRIIEDCSAAPNTTTHEVAACWIFNNVMIITHVSVPSVFILSNQAKVTHLLLLQTQSCLSQVTAVQHHQHLA